MKDMFWANKPATAILTGLRNGIWSENKCVGVPLSFAFKYGGVSGGRSVDKSVAVPPPRLISWSPFLSLCRLKRQQHRIPTACLSLTFLFLPADKSAWHRTLSFVSCWLICYSFKHFPECCAVTVFVCSVRGRKNTPAPGNVWRPSVLPWLSVSPVQAALFGSSMSSWFRFNDRKCPAA